MPAAPPVINSFTIPAQDGVPSARIAEAESTAANPSPPTTWFATGLPAGLAIASDTGIIFGTPNLAAVTQGSNYVFTGSYSAQNGAGTSTAQFTIAVLGANSPPWIFSQPFSTVAVLNNPINLLVYAATGTSPLQYQWRKNGVALPGATDWALNTSSAQSSDGGNYDVVVSNVNGSVTSQLVSVTVPASSATGSPPTAKFSPLITVSRPDGTTHASIPEQSGFATVDVQATVGDTITIPFQAVAVDGDLFALSLDVFSPDVASTNCASAIGTTRPISTG